MALGDVWKASEPRLRVGPDRVQIQAGEGEDVLGSKHALSRSRSGAGSFSTELVSRSRFSFEVVSVSSEWSGLNASG